MNNSFYQVDSDDRIIGVSESWDSFALDNDGKAATAHKVLGTLLWDHIHQFEVKSYLNAIFFSVRQKGEIVCLPYRCDSLMQSRAFLMTVRPLSYGGLCIEHDEVKTSLALVKKAPLELHSYYSHMKCSVCCSFKVGDEWVDPFSEPLEIDFPKGLGICPKCKAEAAAVLAASDQSKKSNVIAFHTQSKAV